MRVTSSRLEWMLISTSVLVIAAAWLFTYWNIVEDRELTRSSSVKIIDSLAISLEEHLNVTLRDARNAVYSAALLIENAGGFGNFRNAEYLHKELNRELHDDASTARLVAVDGRGRIVASSSEYPLPDVPVARQEAFAWHASHPAEHGFHLGVPHKSAVGGKMVIPYSRAVFDRSDGVAGVVVAELSTEYLAGLYTSLTGAIHASVVVFNHDGIILMRVPFDEKFLGQSATSPSAFKKQLEASGNSEFTSAWDGKTRYYSHRVMHRDPVLIAVGVDKEDVMVPSTSRTRHRVALTGAATLVLLALTGLLLADLRRIARSEERLRDLSRRIVDIEESERRKINRELHDSVGQNLSALALNLEVIRGGLAAHTPGLGSRLDDARDLLEATSRQVRNVMADLRPAALDDYGLFAALRHHATTVSARTGIEIDVQGADLERRLPPAVETAFFRIAQEALNNAGKHAKTKRVALVLEESPSHVRLGIRDEGIGFETSRPAGATPSYGLATMSERAESVGARLKIVSAPGTGTRVEVEVTRAEA